MKKINLDEPQKVRAIGNGAHVFVPKTLVGQMMYILTEKQYEDVDNEGGPGEPITEDTPLPEPLEISPEMQKHIKPRKKFVIEATCEGKTTTNFKPVVEAKSEVKKLEDPDVEAERHFLESLQNAKTAPIRDNLIRKAERQFGKERTNILVEAINK